ncbi:hypothetical protein chiPu_0020384 [Chiloscyllium punctatum]|uniref:Uncharacterized protein n=1 Tax=Chiloscyllium punctatum TaxID=137246 RepID=A0A401RF21_CHIPU|nr:hypothetical protein [Chiloscyllium punctatum]
MLQCPAKFQDIVKHHQSPKVKDRYNKTLTTETPPPCTQPCPPYAPQSPRPPLPAPEPDPLLNEAAAFVTKRPTRNSQQDTAAAEHSESLL